MSTDLHLKKRVKEWGVLLLFLYLKKGGGVLLLFLYLKKKNEIS